MKEKILIQGSNGSSPQVRGTVLAQKLNNPVHRFIPAGAGNGSQQLFQSKRDAVHPRRCGERSDSGAWGEKSAGSSPQVRGTVNDNTMAQPGRPFIPAGAGNI